MRTVKNILFISLLASFILVSINTYASVIVIGTIKTQKTSDKYTLKNLSASALKTATFATLKASFQYKGFVGIDTKEPNKSNNYLMYNKGNISYVIPYHYNVLVAKFKTPTAP